MNAAIPAIFFSSVTLEDTPKAESEQQIDAEADDEKERSETEADENISRISGVTWKLDIGESDYPEFHGGISPQDYFEEFDEDGEPIETSYKTWAGYHEANQDYNGSAYVYTPVLPEEYYLIPIMPIFVWQIVII